MVGPKPKPVRPLNTVKSEFEKPSEIKTVGKKKGKKVEAKLPSKELKVGKDVSDPPLSQETKVESGGEKMSEPAYPEPGKVIACWLSICREHYLLY